MKRSLMSTLNLGNSIIGVSILAMPFCFKHCGVFLSIFLVSLSACVNYFSCSLLLKCARINRRRNYELLAFDAFGSSGKTLVELSILFFLIGTCVAFFVIVADIGPSILCSAFGLENGAHIRAFTLVFLALAGVLPCGFLRNVDHLTSFSFISLIVYSFLALRMFSLAFEKFVSPLYLNLWDEINYWDSSWVITYLPIFSMAFSCQPQLFEVFHYDLQQHRSYKSIMRSIKRAIYITSLVYILIGFFGYIAFYDHSFTGNILQSLPSGAVSQLTLLAFLVTLLTSFPLLLFPCRTSLHSLLFRKGGYNDFLSTAHSIHMSEMHFKLLTILIIVVTMGIAIFFPHVELVLALIGSTIGTVICFVLPALIFVKITDRNTIDSLLAYLLLSFGAIILVFCSLSVVVNLSKQSDVQVKKTPLPISLSSKMSTISTTSTKPTASFVKDNKAEEDRSRMIRINKLKEALKKKQEEDKLKFLSSNNPVVQNISLHVNRTRNILEAQQASSNETSLKKSADQMIINKAPFVVNDRASNKVTKLESKQSDEKVLETVLIDTRKDKEKQSSTEAKKASAIKENIPAATLMPGVARANQSNTRPPLSRSSSSSTSSPSAKMKKDESL